MQLRDGAISTLFLPRAMLKGPKRSFVVLVLVVVVLGVESSSKNVPNGTKIVQENKKCSYHSKRSS